MSASASWFLANTDMLTFLRSVLLFRMSFGYDTLAVFAVHAMIRGVVDTKFPGLYIQSRQRTTRSVKERVSRTIQIAKVRCEVPLFTHLFTAGESMTLLRNSPQLTPLFLLGFTQSGRVRSHELRMTFLSCSFISHELISLAS
jgi:hypothetical protein